MSKLTKTFFIVLIILTAPLWLVGMVCIKIVVGVADYLDFD